MDASDDLPVFLVAHSGAGPLLPAMGAALPNEVAGYVFVDAGHPKHGARRMDLMPKDLVSRIRAMAKDGWLPPWPGWWDEAVRELVPDEKMRLRFVADCPRVPLDLFEEKLPVPEGWPDAPGGYLRLSAAYDAEAEEARSRGWALVSLSGTHLHMINDPAAVTDALLNLVRDMGDAT